MVLCYISNHTLLQTLLHYKRWSISVRSLVVTTLLHIFLFSVHYMSTVWSGKTRRAVKILTNFPFSDQFLIVKFYDTNPSPLSHGCFVDPLESKSTKFFMYSSSWNGSLQISQIMNRMLAVTVTHIFLSTY